MLRKRKMQKKLYLIALISSVALTACAGQERLKTVSDGCLLFKPLSYAELPPGQVDDPGNKADTPETVKQIDEHDAVYEAVCKKPK